MSFKRNHDGSSLFEEGGLLASHVKIIVVNGGSIIVAVGGEIWGEQVDERNQSNGQGDGGLFIGLRIVCRKL